MAAKTFFVVNYTSDSPIEEAQELYVIADNKTKALQELPDYDEGTLVYEVQVVAKYKLKSETKHSLEPVK